MSAPEKQRSSMDSGGTDPSEGPGSGRYGISIVAAIISVGGRLYATQTDEVEQQPGRWR